MFKNRQKPSFFICLEVAVRWPLDFICRENCFVIFLTDSRGYAYGLARVAVICKLFKPALITLLSI